MAKIEKTCGSTLACGGIGYATDDPSAFFERPTDQDAQVIFKGGGLGGCLGRLSHEMQ
jgi:hypothetical protein